jgi:membrane fusion protein
MYSQDTYEIDYVCPRVRPVTDIPARTRSKKSEPQQEPGERTLLFRPAALEQRQQQWLGEVVLTGSARQLATSILFFGIAVAVVSFFFLPITHGKKKSKGE